MRLLFSSHSIALVLGVLLITPSLDAEAQSLKFMRPSIKMKKANQAKQLKSASVLKSLVKRKKRTAIKFKRLTIDSVNRMLKKAKKGSRGAFKALTLDSKIPVPNRRGARGKSKVSAKKYLAELNKLAAQFAAAGYSPDDSGAKTVATGQFDNKNAELKRQRRDLSKKFGKIKPLRVFTTPKFAASKKSRGRQGAKLYLLPKAKYLKGLPKSARGSRGKKKKAYTWKKEKVWGPYGSKGTAAVQLKADMEFYGSKDRVQFDAGASVDGWVFKKRKTIFGAKALLKGDNKAAGGKGQVTAKLTTTILGKTYTLVNKKVKSFKKTGKKSYQKEWGVKIRFVLAVIPMSAEVGASFETGIRWELDVKATQISASVTPFIQADAFARLAIDVFVAAAGIEGRVTLVDAEVSLHGNAGVAGDSKGLFAYAGLAADLGVEALNGALSAFVKVKWCLIACEKKYTWQIFGWKGFRKTWRLFSVEKKVYIVGEKTKKTKPAPTYKVKAGPVQPSGRRVEGYWGTWQRTVSKCPKDYFASGFRQKVEPNQKRGDDTALNAIQLRCRHRNPKSKKMKVIKSIEARWGKWSGWTECPRGHYLTRFNLRLEGKQGKRDDTAANDVQFKCSNGKTLIANRRGGWGAWINGQSCGRKGYINGFRTRVEGSQGKRDDTGLNGLEIICGAR